MPHVSSALTAAANPFQEWQRYAVEGEEFSVSLPVLPAMSTRKVVLRDWQQSQTRREIGSYLNGVIYTIRTFENVTGQSLDDFIAAQSSGRILSNALNISVSGFAGKEFESTARNTAGRVQFFKTKKHLYEFAAQSISRFAVGIQQFFDSLDLGGEKQGTKIEDGIGAVPVESPAGEQFYTGKDVDQRVVLVMKPEPSYTETARQQQVTGTVILKTVFSSKGNVINIRIISELPFGLTERAITAAKKIKFMPAMKNGQFVSMWIQLEYNFDLY